MESRRNEPQRIGRIMVDQISGSQRDRSGEVSFMTYIAMHRPELAKELYEKMKGGTR